ncbi:MAG TPA: nucleoside-diphosphate sugar epimerase/dehydratase [Gaiellaceae bacterium]|nr:nucleoside-diphosphate sugar epimerase/dehydratase [Gaiellaceae bacterium]
MIPINRHRVWNVFADAILIAIAWWLAFWLRFDHGVPKPYARLMWDTLAPAVVISLGVFIVCGFYNRWWRYVSTRDMWGAARGVTAACVVTDLVVLLAHPVKGFQLPRSVAVLDWLLLLAAVAGTRLIARTLIERPGAASLVARGKEVIIVGAGDAAQLVIREMQRTPGLGYTPIGLVDDDPRKKHLRLHGVRVLGTTGELPQVLREFRPDEVLIAIPSASGEDRRRVVDTARDARVPVKTLPGLYELISGDLNLTGQIRPVEVQDVLGRTPVEVDLASIASYLAGETVLVTGAGGSIGAELCRQIARVAPARLVLVENSEAALFDIERELLHERDFSAVATVLGDCGDRAKMSQVFERYRPRVVFHAAAYKHVALLEANPLEALRNNTLATKTVAEVAVEFGAARFVLVSTDKAANPKNLLGQSKAVCEWIVEAYGNREDVETRFVAVRFGNVLNSSGSVIPIFRRQIEKGGPVTVTHPEMTRYFMTIPEAVSLIVQAGAIGGRGQVYVLDMGEPVKILDLAHNMIRLSGKEPETDIAIEYIGAKPGEKLHEELWSPDETVGPTSHSKILRAARRPIDAEWLDDELAELQEMVARGETLDVVSKLATMMREPRRVGAAILEDTMH